MNDATMGKSYGFVVPGHTGIGAANAGASVPRLPHKLAVKTAPAGYKAKLRRLKKPAKAGFAGCSRDLNRRKSQNFAAEPDLDEFPGLD